MDLHFINKEDAPDMPTVLYKYRTWEKEEHRRLLTHGEIYYSSPVEFDEVTECNLERDYSSVTDEMIRVFCRNEAMRQVDNGEIPVSQVLNKTKELYDNHQFFDPKNRKESERLFREHLNNSLSIFCASESPMNERLWNSFAGRMTGYCVGIDFSNIYGNDEVFGSCGKVEYYDESNPPKILPISNDSKERVLNMMKIIYSLPNKFQDEQEFRLTKMFIQNKTIRLDPTWINQVIVGSNMLSSHEDTLVSIVKEKYPHASLKKLFVEPTSGYMSLIDYPNN